MKDEAQTSRSDRQPQRSKSFGKLLRYLLGGVRRELGWLTGREECGVMFQEWLMLGFSGGLRHTAAMNVTLQFRDQLAHLLFGDGRWEMP